MGFGDAKDEARLVLLIRGGFQSPTFPRQISVSSESVGCP
jgi:hypothetical protein